MDAFGRWLSDRIKQCGGFLDMVHEVGLGWFKNNVALIEWCLRGGKVCGVALLGKKILFNMLNLRLF